MPMFKWWKEKVVPAKQTEQAKSEGNRLLAYGEIEEGHESQGRPSINLFEQMNE